jgi:hypothetical protein
MPTKKENLMKTMFGALKAILGVAILATVFASLANAQCLNVGVSKRGTSMLQHQSWNGKFSPALFKLVAEGETEASPADQDHHDPIVGFWRVDLISEGNSGIPDGTVLDAGFTQWHSDGTEILNSSRPPAIGSFCLGVWEKTKPSSYKLNHFTISWNPNETLQGPGNIREEITLSPDHNSYVGTFTLDQYNSGGNLLVHLAGRVKAKRITLDTTITDVL